MNRMMKFAIAFAMGVGAWVFFGAALAIDINWSVVPWLGLDRISVGQGMMLLLIMGLFGIVLRYTSRPSQVVTQLVLPKPDAKAANSE